MRRVLAIHDVDLDITVEAGIGYIELNDWLKKHHAELSQQQKSLASVSSASKSTSTSSLSEPVPLWFPLDPGPGASIGGMCGTRCSGSTAVRYGSMRENVLSLTAVLADGTIVRTGSRARKSSAGYDLTRLFIGSEGTLAVVTEVTLKLHPIPNVSSAILISFDDVREAAAMARDTLSCGVSVGRCELMDEEMVRVLNRVSSITNISSLFFSSPHSVCLCLRAMRVRVRCDGMREPHCSMSSSALQCSQCRSSSL